MKKIIICLIITMLITSTVNAAEVPRESAPCNATNVAIWQYRDMYLRPDFYKDNLEKVRVIITPVIEEYKSGKITYAEAEFNARTEISQSVNPSFNPDVEYMKDPLSRDIPSVDKSLFILVRKLLLSNV